MATLVEYLDQTKVIEALAGYPNRTAIGYLNMSPENTLRNLMPDYHVVEYLGVIIPTNSEFTNLNSGLKLSEVPSGIGLVGTIEMLNKSELYQSCKRESFSGEERKKIREKLKSRLRSDFPEYLNSLDKLDSQKYILIFDILGEKMTVKDLDSLLPRFDFKPIPNGGIIFPEDFPFF